MTGVLSFPPKACIEPITLYPESIRRYACRTERSCCCTVPAGSAARCIDGPELCLSFQNLVWMAWSNQVTLQYCTEADTILDKSSQKVPCTFCGTYYLCRLDTCLEFKPSYQYILGDEATANHHHLEPVFFQLLLCCCRVRLFTK